jgi:hypothetical protein
VNFRHPFKNGSSFFDHYHIISSSCHLKLNYPNLKENVFLVITEINNIFTIVADHGDTIATFISKHLLKFPHWLKIVCTVRTDMLEITKLLPFQKVR